MLYAFYRTAQSAIMCGIFVCDTDINNIWQNILRRDIILDLINFWAFTGMAFTENVKK